MWRHIERRVLTHFLDWLERRDGPGSFTAAMRVKAELYLLR